MIEITDEQMKELQRLCREFGVVRLDLFGSAATDDFDPATSDVDFLVRYGEHRPAGGFTSYFHLKTALERLFDRKVDLVESGAVRNRFFRREMERTRTPVYGA